MTTVLRVLVGGIGVLAVLLALRCWMAPEAFASELGIAPIGPLGLASLRADLGAFFGVVGVLALAAGIRARGELLLAPVLLVGVALAGRMLSIGLEGFSPDMMRPIVVEAVLLAVFGAGWRLLPRA
jgi:uncharacterized membrane protein